MHKINKDTEDEIFRLALEALGKNVPAHIEIETLAPEPGQVQADRLLRIVAQGKELRYYAEIKTAVTKTHKLLLFMHREKLQYPLLLITKYINAQMAEQLRQDGVEFIDTAGNALINQPPLYLFVKGNKPPEIAKQAKLTRAFKPAGLRMIYAFLCNPGLENKTYREIAAVANVALGTVDWIMKELKGLGFLLDMGKRGQRLTQRENLLQRWVTAYPEQLRPKLIMGRFGGEYGWWKQKKLHPLKAQWGGEIAAARLTQYLEPEMITIYTTTQELNPLLIENRLKKDQTGEVEILERFWKQNEVWRYEDMVHPILIYADLLATGNQRNIETAKIVYEQHILQLIRED
ncbi:MAG: type IV toxin-antitoxin system AbiEi family antitoxin [bacterium]